MKFWPYETFELNIPRPPEEAAKALSAFVRGGLLRETLQYKPMSGKVTGLSFVILSKAYRDRSPDFYFYGDIHPNGAGSRVAVTLKCPLFPWIFGGGVVIILLGMVYFALRYPVGPDMVQRLVPLPILVLLFLYVPYIVGFWSAQTRKRDLEHVMTYYGTQAQIESID